MTFLRHSEDSSYLQTYFGLTHFFLTYYERVLFGQYTFTHCHVYKRLHGQFTFAECTSTINLRNGKGHRKKNRLVVKVRRSLTSYSSRIYLKLL